MCRPTPIETIRFGCFRRGVLGCLSTGGGGGGGDGSRRRVALGHRRRWMCWPLMCRIRFPAIILIIIVEFEWSQGWRVW